MKYFAVIVLVAIVTGVFGVTDEQRAKAAQHATECAKDHNVKEDTVKQLLTGKLSDDSKDVRCFVNCFMTKAGFMKDGVFQDALAKEKLSMGTSNSNINNIVEKCKNTHATDNCDKAYEIFMCYSGEKASLF